MQGPCKEIAVPLASKKMEGPANSLTFMGIQLDSLRQTLALPAGKHSEILSTKHFRQGRVFCSKSELRSLSGSLHFSSKCVPPSRLFTRRLIAKLWSGTFLPNLDAIVHFQTTYNSFCQKRTMPRNRSMKPGRDQKYDAINLESERHIDIRCWLSFAEMEWHSVFYRNRMVKTDITHLFTDASGTLGLGAYFNGRWSWAPWPTWP